MQRVELIRYEARDTHVKVISDYQSVSKQKDRCGTVRGKLRMAPRGGSVAQWN